MDPDGDDLEIEDFEADTNTQQNIGDALSPKARLSIDKTPYNDNENNNDENNYIAPTDDPEE